MRPTIVLLHGFSQTGAGWQPTIAALGERYRPLAPDIRGHGRTAALRPVDLDGVLADIAELAPERFTLAGYSMGGRIALHAAFAWPARVERLVLVSSSPGLAGADERAARRAADERLAGELEQGTIAEFEERWGSQPLFAGQPVAVREAARADRLRNDPHALAAALRGLGTGTLPSLWDRLGELVMPVTLVVGERDERYRGIAERMAAAIPQAQVVTIAGAGHALPLEAPTELAAAL